MAATTSATILNAAEAFYRLDEILCSGQQTAKDILEGPPRQSPLLVSIDLEYCDKYVSQLGVTTLDPLSLSSRPLEDLITIDEPVSTVFYLNYNLKNDKRWHFGIYFQRFKERKLQKLLVEILSPTDDEGNLRDVIVIGHSIHHDFRVLNRLAELDVPKLQAVKAVIDTQCFSKYVFGHSRQVRLKNLLKAFGIDGTGFHNAGNDSRYTMSAMLLLYCKLKHEWQQPKNTTMERAKERLALIETIAYWPEVPKHTLRTDTEQQVSLAKSSVVQTEKSSKLMGQGYNWYLEHRVRSFLSQVSLLSKEDLCVIGHGLGISNIPQQWVRGLGLDATHCNPSALSSIS